jgi:acyl carrier protein
VRYHGDGNLEYQGRVDQQVKIRGYRIELGEIETVLREHSAIQDAVVLAREDVAGDKRLVAYVVGSKEVTVNGALRSFLHDRLPAYMIPSVFVSLDALPLTSHGKVDRRALPVPQKLQERNSIHLPRTPIEILLAEIWREVLGGEQISLFDNFFESGGHSLLATQFVARVRTELQIELPLRKFFEAPTLMEIARFVEQEKATLIMQTDSEELAQALAMAEALSEDEIKMMVSSKKSQELNEREKPDEQYS